MKNFSSPADIRVGVIGYGGAYNMGRRHLEQMKAAGMTPVAVCEVDPKRLAVATAEFPGIQTYESVERLLRESDASLMVIITPHNTHADLALQCLNAGLHVVCEKPLAITTREVDAMIKAAEKAGVMLTTYHNRHWDGRILQAVELVKEKGVIGEVVRVECRMGGYGQPGDSWRGSRSISGGILYDFGVHLLEYTLQIIDSPITEVSGFAHEGFWGPKTSWGEDANEDEATAIVRFQSGQYLTLRFSQLESNPKPGWVEFTGTRGSLVIDGPHSTLYQRTKAKATTTQMPNPPEESEGHRYYDHVRDHLVFGKELIITAAWSRRPIHILDLAAQSAKMGKALKPKYP